MFSITYEQSVKPPVDRKTPLIVGEMAIVNYRLRDLILLTDIALQLHGWLQSAALHRFCALVF
jgi:hypothetical protein